MKRFKILAVMLLALSLLATTACGGDESSSSTDSASKAESQAASEAASQAASEDASEAPSSDAAESKDDASEGASADESLAEESSAEESSEAAPGELVADIFSLEFTADGAKDKVTGESLEAIGTPTTKEVDGKYIGVFDGQSGYIRRGFDEHYEALTYSMSIESYFKIDSITTEYTDLFSNQQTGGMGIEIYKGTDPVAKAVLSVFLDGDYRFPGGDITLGEYVHFVATYDGEDITVYIDGEMVDIYSTASGITWTTNEYSKNLVVGADSDHANGIQAGSYGEVAIANIYSTPLTEEQVLELYQAATAK